MAAAFTIAGGIIGGMVGAPNVGILVGSIIGNLLFPPKGQDQVGPRLTDLKVQTGTYGVGIPTLYGRSRFTGNVIACTEKQEHENKQSQGGGFKGGMGGPTMTTYTYTVTMAVALCEGPIKGVPKIWAMNKLIYNVSDEASASTMIASGLKARKIKLYFGDENQLPDPTLEAIFGKDNVSAYRGTAYIVFEDLDITEWGSIPNLEFEVIQKSMKTIGHKKTNILNEAIKNPLERKSYTIDYDGVFVGTENGPVKINDKDYLSTLVARDKANVAKPLGVSDDNYGLTEYYNSKKELNVCLINTEGSVINLNPARDIVNNKLKISTAFAYYNPITRRNKKTLTTVSASGRTHIIIVKDENLYEPIIITPPDNAEAAGNLAYFDFNCLQDNYFYIQYGIKAEEGDPGWYKHFYIDKYDYNGNFIEHTYDLMTFTGFQHKSIMPQLMMGLGNDQFIFAVSPGKPGDPKTSFFNECYTWTFNKNSIKPYPIGLKWEYNSGDTNDVVTPFIIEGTYFISTYGGGMDYGYYIYYDQNIINRVPLSAIVADQFSKTLQSTNLIDVSGIEDVTTSGYVVTRKDAIRSNLEPLLKLYYIDCVESDGKIKFVKRGGNTAVVIPEDDLSVHGYGAERPDNMVIERVQNIDLPSKIIITYMDLNGAYQIGSQYASRQATNGVNNTKTVEAAITLVPDEAKRMAEVILQEAWQARNTITIELGPKYCYLEPTDIIKAYKYGDLYTLRIIEINEQNNILTIKCVSEDITKYSQEAIGAPMPKPTDDIPLVLPTIFKFLDIPLLRDSDNEKGCYYAVGSTIADKSWKGCTIYESLNNGATYQNLKNKSTNSIIGYTTNKLNDFKGGLIFDEINSVNITVNSDLSSFDELSVLNGVNLAIVGNEIIQFKNANLISANSYKLSGLIRGKFGTEWAMSKHTESDQFVLLSGPGIDIMYLDSSQYDMTKYYKAVTFSDYESSTSGTSFKFEAVAQECYSPVGLGGGRDSKGNIQINWIRRSRVNNYWNNYIDVPVGELEEAYEIDITNSSGAVIRTYKTSEPTLMYSIEDQITDFKSIQSKVNYTIYQMSSARGRGFPASSTI